MKKKNFSGKLFYYRFRICCYFLLRQSFEQSMNSGFETVNEFVVFCGLTYNICMQFFVLGNRAYVTNLPHFYIIYVLNVTAGGKCAVG